MPQDMFDPDDKIRKWYSSFIHWCILKIVVAMKKLKLKEDEDGNKIYVSRYSCAGCKVMKTRYAKSFVQVKIPDETGMNPTVDYLNFLRKKVLSKSKAPA